MKDSSQKFPFQTRSDMIRAALAVLEPLPKYLSPGKTRLFLSAPFAHYGEDIAAFEGFSRVLWLLILMLKGEVKEAEPYWALWKEGIIHGTDPGNEEYWGEIGPYDQRMVEMAVFGMGLCLIPERFYGELPDKTKKDLYSWLDQINHYDMPANNWKFFRVLVNAGFLAAGLPADVQQMEADLTELDTHYTKNGWYFDKPTQRDYYTLWAFHFFGMLYSYTAHERDKTRADQFIARTTEIMPRFACWFDGVGRALPYGRSLTYRFAQSVFWGGCALCGITTPEFGYGEIKGLILRNLRFWFRLPIFSKEGILSVGYGYPNYVVSEGYNSSGSPYWGLKAFIVLALKEGHPFWLAKEKPHTPPLSFCDEECLQLLTRDRADRMVISYTAGNHAYEHMHEDEKYEKFAYSTQFAFSVVKEAGTLKKGAYDSMLVVRRPEHDLWHGRSGCDSFSVRPEGTFFTWQPLPGIRIESEILPAPELWHVRRHIIHADFDFEAAEGAFAIPKETGRGPRLCDVTESSCAESAMLAAAYGTAGSSGILAVSGWQNAAVITPEPNTNLMSPRTLLPMLTGSFKAGKTVLVSAVYAHPGEMFTDHIPEEVMKLALRH